MFLAKTKITKETIWVTGASSGIGYALAKTLADKGNTIIVSARNQEKLEELCSVSSNIRALPFDVSKTQDIDRIRCALEEEVESIDRVILAAGTCEYFSLPDDAAMENRWAIFERIMSVNYIGMINSINASLPLLLNAKNPQIVGICSLASEAPFPKAAAYGASKAAAKYMLDSFRLDLNAYGVEVTTILPGFVDTPLTRKNSFHMPFIMSTEKACKKIIDAITKRKMQYAFPKRLAFSLTLAKLFPGIWLKMMSPKSNTKGEAT